MKKHSLIVLLLITCLSALFLSACSSRNAVSVFSELGEKSNKVAVIYLVEGNANIIPPETVEKGSVITLPDAYIENNKILGWSDVSPYFPSMLNVGDSYIVNQSVMLFAILEHETSVMVYFDVKGDIGHVFPKYALKESTIKLPNAVVANHTMLGWSESSTNTDNLFKVGESYFVTQETILYAVLEKNPPPYTTADTQFSIDGIIDESLTRTADAGSSIELPYVSPIDSDSMFLGWSASENGGTIRPGGTNYIANKNATLYAVFKSILSVVFVVDGDYTVFSPLFVEPDTYITLPEGTVEAGEITGWRNVNSIASVLYPSGSIFLVQNSVVLEAVLEQKYTVTYNITVNDINRNSDNSLIPQMRVGSGAAFTLPDYMQQIDNCTLIGWKFSPGDSYTMPVNSSCTVYADTTLYAVFAELVTVTFDIYGYTSIIDPITVYKGTVVSLPAADNYVYDSYRFDGWSLSPAPPQEKVNNYYTVNNNVTLYPVVILQVTVTYNVQGSVKHMPTATVDVNSKITVPDISPKLSGYRLDYWETGTTKYYAGSSYTVTSDVIFYAVLIEQAIITFNVSGSASVIPSVAYDINTDFNLPSISVNNYDFHGWTETADITGKVLTAGTVQTANANKTYYAKLTRSQATIQFSVNGSISASLTQTVNTQTYITLPSPDIDGFHIQGWTANSNGTGTVYMPDNSYYATSSIILYAKLIAVTESYTFRNISGSECLISGYTGTALNLTIPSANGNRAVVGIYEGAFMNNTEIISVKLPSTVKAINKNAFFGASNLTTINLENIITIGSSAFSGANKLKISSLNTIAVLTSIGSEAFANACADSLDYSTPFIIIPSITNIGLNAFSGWISTQTIDITAVNYSYTLFANGWSGGKAILLDNNQLGFTFAFNIQSSECTVIGYTGSEIVVVPEQVFHNGKYYKVTAIANGALSNSGITIVKIIKNSNIIEQ